MRQNEPSALLIALPIIFILLIITVVIVAALLLTDMLGVVGATTLPSPSPSLPPTPPPAGNILTTPAASATSFHSTALGFALAYPPGWRKQEQTLAVIISPSRDGLDPANFQAGALRAGIPAGNTLDHAELLRGLLVQFPPPIEVMNQGTMSLAGENWTWVEFTFGQSAQGQAGQGFAAATNKNEVGYFIVAAAPAPQWPGMQPVFQQTINSFHFTEDAVLRPTDATPPPTPTPTPTPVIYIVQSGDTLLGIALQFGVDANTLAARNGIEVPEHLQTGQKLIIPLK
ncbi:MAG: LysM peptidoglycan-binding domain-containing protein [Anaerolineae bacterium]|nr:LysM peptidoglycan-binding domain-containing protein [Anaerolineae bacterium]